MLSEQLKNRTKKFALRVLNVVDHLPASIKGRTIARQLADSGTSVAANYRAACRARSRSEFIAKIGTVIEEADESAFWLELIMEDNLLKKEDVHPLWDEANQIVAIMTKSRKTAQSSR